MHWRGNEKKEVQGGTPGSKFQGKGGVIEEKLLTSFSKKRDFYTSFSGGAGRWQSQIPTGEKKNLQETDKGRGGGEGN